ncbi:MAG: carbohydrate ABC transporter permease [Chloroflexi bacterium]|nr:MAG: carbohydrate ABC transporter permease [Chloroflexota bacterium]RLC89297.1 MAG: carbohydrate ABC transporter permease [Chloroflexota bacterium]HEY68113.1 carbohydrate ABC transporter permease [Thermoflexia bacterium]
MLRSKRARKTVFAIFWYIVLGITAVAVMLPYIWMLSTSLKGSDEVFAYPPNWIPRTWRFQNYVEAWNAAPFGRYFLNSAVVALAVTIGQLITCSLAAFAFARMEFKGKDVMFALFLSTTMISTQVTLVPSYLVLKTLRWLDTYQALIVPFLANAFGVFMMRQYFMTLPRELEDAAKLDGCGRLRFLWQVLLPLSKPIVASQALFAFMGNWNSYLWPLIVTTSEHMRTLQIGLRYFVSQEGGTQWGIFMAATVFVSVPIVLFYLFVQKSFVEGIATTGLKGA